LGSAKKRDLIERYLEEVVRYEAFGGITVENWYR